MDFQRNMAWKKNFLFDNNMQSRLQAEIFWNDQEITTKTYSGSQFNKLVGLNDYSNQEEIDNENLSDHVRHGK